MPGDQPQSGADFVFAAGLSKIEEQSKLVDALDVKMGVLIAFLGALALGFLASVFASEPAKLDLLLKETAKLGLAVTGILVVRCALFLIPRVPRETI